MKTRTESWPLVSIWLLFLLPMLLLGDSFCLCYVWSYSYIKWSSLLTPDNKAILSLFHPVYWTLYLRWKSLKSLVPSLSWKHLHFLPLCLFSPYSFLSPFLSGPSLQTKSKQGSSSKGVANAGQGKNASGSLDSSIIAKTKQMQISIRILHTNCQVTAVCWIHTIV